MEALRLTDEREHLHWSSIKQVSVEEVLAYINQTGLTKNDLADVLEKSTRTIDNMRTKQDKLSVRETETFIKLREMMDLGMKIFGNSGFIRWLEKENSFFDGFKPKGFLRTDSGIDLIKEQLFKLAYGYVA
jgi:uncharacterized protein (DUF2384 family)